MSHKNQPQPKVLPGHPFTKTWTVQNTGKVAWPEDTTFEHSEKTYMQTVPVRANKVVQPGEFYTWTVTMIAPFECRIHSSVFKMKSKGEEFGDKCLCELQVCNKL